MARRRGGSKYQPVQLFGDEALDRAFMSLPRGVRNKAVRPAVTAMARNLVKSAKRIAPKLTGALRRSIKSRVNKTRAGKSLKTKVSRAVFTDAAHAPAVELGTQHVQPQSFLRRALREDGPGILAMGRGMIWRKTKELAAAEAKKGKAEVAKGAAR